MQIVIEIPDEIARRLQKRWSDLTHKVLELVGLYKYTRLSPSLPPIPILQVQLFQPGASRTTALACSAILDTGN